MRVANFDWLRRLSVFGVAFAFFPAITVHSQNAPGQIRVQKVIQLAGDRGGYLRPTWSPDGSMIALARPAFAGVEIIEADGSGWKVLTAEAGSGYKFAWSPDGRHIAFRVTVEESNRTAYVIKSVETSTGKTRTLSDLMSDVQPPSWAWSRDQMHVALLAGGKRTNTAPGELKSVAGASTPIPADQVLYFHKGNIWICNEDGTQGSPLTEDGGMEPVWSPDRRKIVYSAMDTLVVMDADGKNKLALARGHRPSWSPDGKKLVYQVTADDGHRIISSDLFIINADGTENTQLTRTPTELEVEPGWSPDGRRIVYRLEDTGQVYVLVLE